MRLKGEGEFLKVRIYNALMALVATSGVFFEVRYAGDGSIIVGQDSVKPIGVIANELSGAFESSDNMRNERLDRRQIDWQLRVQFNTEVACERFEDLMRDVPRIDSDDRHPNTALFLRGVQYTHPPRKNPGTGTVAVYTIAAVPQRS